MTFYQKLETRRRRKEIIKTTLIVLLLITVLIMWLRMSHIWKQDGYIQAQAELAQAIAEKENGVILDYIFLLVQNSQGEMEISLRGDIFKAYKERKAKK